MMETTTEALTVKLEEVISNIISEDEIVNLAKKYFYRYLDSILDDPEGLLKNYIESKEEEVQSLKDAISGLQSRISFLEARMQGMNWSWSVNGSNTCF